METYLLTCSVEVEANSLEEAKEEGLQYLIDLIEDHSLEFDTIRTLTEE